MFDKSLVSIYFLKNRIIIAELDSRKKKVRKSASFELPAGIIEDYKVQDIKGLSEILKGVWNKFGFSEKSVGLVIPEFSTFTKIIKIPEISLSELQEAITWQAQEYLPTGGENSIMDWKIVERNDKSYEVMIVAVDRTLLMGYVKACELAGLFPLVVQTPSSVLVNSVREDKALIIYAGFDEVVIIASDKEKILGTSVLTDASIRDVLETYSKISRHFGLDDNSKLYVGGGQINDNLVKELRALANKEVTSLKPKVAGLDDLKTQEFLIPVSMQLGDLKEPSDPKTINLLPENLVEKYKREKVKIQVWSLTLTTTLFTWVSFLLVLGSYLVITQQIIMAKAKNSEKASISQTRTKYQNEAKRINDISAKVLKISSQTIVPQEVLNVIEKAKPPGVTIISRKMDLEKGKISIGGKSADRNSLITFKQNLELNEKVTQVEIPISSFENETNLEFNLAFQYGKPLAPTPLPVPKVKVEEF